MIYKVGKELGAFWPGWDTGGEAASCAGGWENSTALQAPQRDQTVSTSVESEVWCVLAAVVVES